MGQSKGAMDAANLHFGPFRLDPGTKRLWRELELLHLRSKAFAVLHLLVRHSRRLVRHEELIEAVWENSPVSESVLRGYIRDLRRALGDSPSCPRYIETVAGRGYRFLAEVRREEAPGATRAVDLRPSPELRGQHE